MLILCTLPRSRSSTDLKAWSEGVKALSVEVNVLSNEVKAAGAALDVEQAETSTIASSPRRVLRRAALGCCCAAS